VLSKKLAKNGLLIIGNYTYESPLQGWMELGVEWSLIYRNKENLLSLVDTLAFQKTIKGESTGVFNFLILKKI